MGGLPAEDISCRRKAPAPSTKVSRDPDDLDVAARAAACDFQRRRMLQLAGHRHAVGARTALKFPAATAGEDDSAVTRADDNIVGQRIAGAGNPPVYDDPEGGAVKSSSTRQRQTVETSPTTQRRCISAPDIEAARKITA
jgi:hypothetical protein